MPRADYTDPSTWEGSDSYRSYSLDPRIRSRQRNLGQREQSFYANQAWWGGINPSTDKYEAPWRNPYRVPRGAKQAGFWESRPEFTGGDVATMTNNRAMEINPAAAARGAAKGFGPSTRKILGGIERAGIQGADATAGGLRARFGGRFPVPQPEPEPESVTGRALGPGTRIRGAIGPGATRTWEDQGGGMEAGDAPGAVQRWGQRGQDSRDTSWNTRFPDAIDSTATDDQPATDQEAELTDTPGYRRGTFRRAGMGAANFNRISQNLAAVRSLPVMGG